jgi:hypothetical protein
MAINGGSLGESSSSVFIMKKGNGDIYIFGDELNSNNSYVLKLKEGNSNVEILKHASGALELGQKLIHEHLGESKKRR